MDYILAKLKIRGSENEKFRRLSSTDELVYPDISEYVANPLDYSPDTLLEADSCYKIESFSSKEFCNAIIKNGFDTVDYDQLTAEEYMNIDYIFVKRDNNLLFQNITKSRLIFKKGIIHKGEDFVFESEHKSIQVNLLPDAIYVSAKNTLYFKKLEAITSIFRGISDLYKEATNEETEQFLSNEFISLKNDFSAVKVKTQNRKRIALAMKTLSELNATDKANIFNYIVDYCPDLKYENGKFSINDELELTNLLYGIEQRFYTTPVGNERRLANSVIKLN